MSTPLAVYGAPQPLARVGLCSTPRGVTVPRRLDLGLPRECIGLLNPAAAVALTGAEFVSSDTLFGADTPVGLAPRGARGRFCLAEGWIRLVRVGSVVFWDLGARRHTCCPGGSYRRDQPPWI